MQIIVVNIATFHTHGTSDMDHIISNPSVLRATKCEPKLLRMHIMLPIYAAKVHGLLPPKMQSSIYVHSSHALRHYMSRVALPQDKR